MSRGPLFLRALPAYLGGKRRLCPALFALLGEAIERDRWRGMTFVDPFLGGGSVSLYAKAAGFRVLSNDLALRSAVVGRALIANSAVKLTKADVVAILQEPKEEYPHVAEKEFSPAVFQAEHAPLIDRVLYRLQTGRFSEPQRSLLTLLLIKWILRLQPMSMLRGTDARAEPVEAPISVRIGLNTGESIEEAGDYFGTAVTLAARIAARAKGGQVLVSEVVRTVGGSLAGVEFRDAGRKQLKGIKGRQRVYEVVWE